MRSIRAAFVYVVFAIASPFALHAQAHTHGEPQLGSVRFPNSGNAAAQPPFLRGIALLHSFEYERAAESFREAQRADPSLALAYWAEALTHSRLLWGLEDVEAARAVLARLAAAPAPRLARAGTPRERSFGEAVESFYADGEPRERLMRYVAALRTHAEADPDDHEAAAFAAHALMVAALTGDDGSAGEPLAREAIGLAQRVARANPHHPGAIHYLIHLYDTPGMAADGLEFARMYDRIAPDSEHALHMPSHIYLQLGLWHDVARSNERAWAASRTHGGAGGGPDWHAFSWLQYAYLQLGRWTEARALIDTARALVPGLHGIGDSRFVQARLEFQYGTETGQWTAPLARTPAAPSVQPSERSRYFLMAAEYWHAVDALQRGDAAAAALAAPFIATADSIRSGASIHPARAARAFVIEALAARARGDAESYLRALRAGAEQERLRTPFVGPPEQLFALELLGEALLQAGDAQAAIDAYEDVLRLCPGRSRALLGAAAAKAAVGDVEGAAAARAALADNWSRADAEVAARLHR